MTKRKAYPMDVSDEEWNFAASYLTLINTDAPQRRRELREMFNALRWIVRAGAPWRLLRHEFPPGNWSINRRNTGFKRAVPRPPASAEPWFQLDACLGVQISHSMSDGI